MSLLNEESTDSLQPKRSLVRWPLILAAITCLLFLGTVIGGIGPCGGLGMLFLLPCLSFGAATVAMLIVNSCRALFRRAAHES